MNKSLKLRLGKTHATILTIERVETSPLGLRLRAVHKYRSQKVLESAIDILLFLEQTLDLTRNADYRSAMQANGFADLVTFFDANFASAEALGLAAANLKSWEQEVKARRQALAIQGAAFKESYESSAKSNCRIEGHDCAWKYADDTSDAKWIHLGKVACDWVLDSGHVDLKLAKPSKGDWKMAFTYPPRGDFDESSDVFEEIIEAQSVNGLLEYIQHHSDTLSFWDCVRLIINLDLENHQISLLRAKAQSEGLEDSDTVD